MLRFIDGDRRSKLPLSRREWLRIGGLGGLGLTLPARRPPLRAAGSERPAIPGFGQAKSVIIVFANGGQSQLDTWDPKPGAPQEIRGAFDSVRTAVPGTLLCEHMPRLAKLADRYTIVRTMSHEDLDHGSAFYLSMTGRYHSQRSSNPLPKPTDHPAYGAVLKRVQPESDFVQPAVHVNGPAQVPKIVGPGQFGGFLGQEYDPMTLGDVTEGRIAVPGLAPQPELPPVRLKARQTLLQALESHRRKLEENRPAADMGVLYRQAFEMLEKPETRNAFDLSAEPASLRDRYGRNRAGQACLLARRLAEAGVPLITVFFNHTNRGQDEHPDRADAYGWDTHNDIFYALTEHLLPRFDLGFSALLEDLDRRGLLDETLVICMGEFGRAPKVAYEKGFAGEKPGRKHWSSVYSIVAAGAGVGRGKVLGQSDRIGAYPASEKYGPWDVCATVFSALGIDPSGHFPDPTDRPFPISTGEPIAGLYQG